MKTVGLIGGMSWESSAEYYRILNETVRDRIGPTASAQCLMWSFNFAEIEELQHKGEWDLLAQKMVVAAKRLEAGGAEILLICTNTMHRMADVVASAINFPLLHIADPTAERIRAAGLKTVGLLGTAFTMEQEFYKGRLAQRHGLNVVVPDGDDRATVHRIIYDELIVGKVLPSSQEAYRAVIRRLVSRGAEAIIFGCTEIMLLVGQKDSDVPVFDTTRLHAEAAVELALALEDSPAKRR